MLLGLSIRDVVLIDKLDLSFESSLSVLTGETGAGKSILLDSLSLALGARADSGMVRPGADRLTVSASFDPPIDHPVRAAVAEQGLEVPDGEPLVLRRSVSADGRSRAHLNDQAVSVGLLREIGDALVEIHGQFENHGLMNPATHVAVLDAHGGLAGARDACARTFAAWSAKAEAHARAAEALARARADEDLLRHNVEELEALAPQPGEEAELDDTRQRMMHAEKLAKAMNEATAALMTDGDGDGAGAGVEGALARAQGALERVRGYAEDLLGPAIDALDRAVIEATEAVAQVQRATAGIEVDPRELEAIEERLFALRGVARKHGCAVDDLPALAEEMARQVRDLEGGGEDVARLARETEAARSAYVEAARSLSKARRAAAERLDAAVAAELPPLKLEAATFRTAIEELPEDQWGKGGLDRVAFTVSTNPGLPPGPIGKVASGGELARFMLALKVVLTGASPIPTLVFDEVDTGIGGATASAVGERLARLGRAVQVLVVTHSPQVAARGAHHMTVAKAEVEPGRVRTSVRPLSVQERREEIARMLSGDVVTDQARAAADSLLGVVA